ALVESVHVGDVIGVVTQRDSKVVDPGRNDLVEIGTFVRVADISRLSGGEYRLSLEGLSRFGLAHVSTDGPFWMGEGAPLLDQAGETEQAQHLTDSLREHVQELASKAGGALGQVALSAAEPGVFADQVASALGLNTEKELSVLRELDVPSR